MSVTSPHGCMRDQTNLIDAAGLNRVPSGLRACRPRLLLGPPPAAQRKTRDNGLALEHNHKRREWRRHDRLMSCFIGLIAAVVSSLAVVAVFAALYLVKSALGIDLFDGPSILHDLFF